MRLHETWCVLGLFPLSLALIADARGQDEPAKTGPMANHWQVDAATYQITLETEPPTPLVLRDEPILKWTNPQRRADDGAVFVWLDRGRPEVAASFYRYQSNKQPYDDHEFVSLAAGPLRAKREGEPVWTVAIANECSPRRDPRRS